MLLWIAGGKSNREIAMILDLSPRTVNKHLEPVFEKLGVDNRTSAAAVAALITGSSTCCDNSPICSATCGLY